MPTGYSLTRPTALDPTFASAESSSPCERGAMVTAAPALAAAIATASPIPELLPTTRNRGSFRLPCMRTSLSVSLSIARSVTPFPLGSVGQATERAIAELRA